MTRPQLMWQVPALALSGGVLVAAVAFGQKPEQATALLEVVSKTTQPGLSVLVVGDMQFDRHIRAMSEREGEDFLFSCAQSLFGKADFVVGNLEGPITPNPSVSEGSEVGSPENYVFTFPTTTAQALAANHVRAVNIGNNHIYNFGAAGVVSTHELLDNAGVGYFGGVGTDEPVYRTEEKGVQLSFVNYNEFGGESPQKVAEKIAAERAQGRVVVVYAHWGDEYTDSTARLRPIAALFAQSGASVVVGSHPHVVLGYEYIGNTPVYYSLGNFIFDQYWDESVRTGLTVLLHITPGGAVSVDEYPVEMKYSGQTCPLVQTAII